MSKMVKRPQTFKYLGLIRTLVAGIAADVLRMRVLKAANDNLMSLEKFLSYWKVNICTELATNTELLSQVFPESEQPESLAAWNTDLLCLVLQTCECLSARETDDVSYVYQIYRKYFLRRPVSIGRRRNTKAEWISLCAAVQRLAEDVDDTDILKAVRNFMCEVEMENTTKQTRQNTQPHLKTMTNEGGQDIPFSKYKNRNMTDDAKAKLNMSHGEINVLGKKKDRPKSASARLIDGRELKKTTESRIDQIGPRSRSAEARHVHNNPSRISLRQGQGHISKATLFHKRERLNTTFQMKNSDIRLHKMKSWPKSSKEKIREYRAIYGSPMRTQSAREHYRRRVSNVAKERRAKSANTLQRKAPTIEATGDPLVNTQKKQSKILEKTDGTFALEERRSKQEVLRRDPYAKYQRQTPNNSSRVNGSIKGRKLMQQKQNNTLSKPPETDKLESMKQKILMQNPTLLNVVAIDENTYKQNGRHIHRTRVVYRQRLKDLEEIKTENKEQDHISQDSEDEVSHTENNNSLEGQQDTRKAAGMVFDENMKLIANEVLVHQNMHRAAKNPYMANKEFVDGFFAFLNENQVTKEFLRAESTEPEQTLRLPDGSQIHLTFLLAFIFRHVESSEMEMVKYVVEKMLLRMQCIHDRISDTSETTIQNKYVVEKDVTDLYSTPVDQDCKNHYSARTGVLPQFVQSNPQRLKHKSAHVNKKTLKQHSVNHSQRLQSEMQNETGFVGKKRVKRFPSGRQSRNCPEISTLLGRKMYVHSSHRERLERVATRKVSSGNKRQSRPRKRSPQLSRRENDVADRSLSATGSDKVAYRKSRSEIIRTKVLEDDSTCIPHKLLRSYGRKNSSPNINTCSLNMVNLNTKESEPASDKASNDMLTSISDKTIEAERVYTIIKNNAKDVTPRETDHCQEQRCWKCVQKELAMSVCVNWGNSALCEMMNSEGIPYKVDHIMAAVKANDILTLRNIVQFLKGTDEWNPESQSVKDALLFAKQNRMQNIALFLHEEGVHEYEHKFANHDSCIPCFVT